MTSVYPTMSFRDRDREFVALQRGEEMSALDVYLLGRCTLGQEELKAAREAHVRYANRDRGSETEKGRSQRLEEIAAAFRKDTATRVANITRYANRDRG